MSIPWQSDKEFRILKRLLSVLEDPALFPCVPSPVRLYVKVTIEKRKKELWEYMMDRNRSGHVPFVPDAVVAQSWESYQLGVISPTSGDVKAVHVFMSTYGVKVGFSAMLWNPDGTLRTWGQLIMHVGPLAALVVRLNWERLIGLPNSFKAGWMIDAEEIFREQYPTDALFDRAVENPEDLDDHDARQWREDAFLDNKKFEFAQGPASRPMDTAVSWTRFLERMDGASCPELLTALSLAWDEFLKRALDAAEPDFWRSAEDHWTDHVAIVAQLRSLHTIRRPVGPGALWYLYLERLAHSKPAPETSGCANRTPSKPCTSQQPIQREHEVQFTSSPRRQRPDRRFSPYAQQAGQARRAPGQSRQGDLHAGSHGSPSPCKLALPLATPLPASLPQASPAMRGTPHHRDGPMPWTNRPQLQTTVPTSSRDHRAGYSARPSYPSGRKDVPEIIDISESPPPQPAYFAGPSLTQSRTAGGPPVMSNRPTPAAASVSRQEPIRNPFKPPTYGRIVWDYLRQESDWCALQNILEYVCATKNKGKAASEKQFTPEKVCKHVLTALYDFRMQAEEESQAVASNRNQRYRLRDGIGATAPSVGAAAAPGRSTSASSSTVPRPLGPSYSGSQMARR